MNITIKLSENPQMARMLKALGYRRKTAHVVTDFETVEMPDTYWDGGSRGRYTAVDIVTQTYTPQGSVPPPQFGGPTVAPAIKLRPGLAVISHGTFCGKPAHATIYMVHSDALIWFGLETAAQLSGNTALLSEPKKHTGESNV